jgi:hypothetical protein
MSALRDELEGLMTRIDEEVESIDNETHLTLQKRKFFQYIQLKIDKLTIRSNILRFKYGSYKKYYDCANIGIIVISTSLTLLESIKGITHIDETNNQVLINSMNIFPILISTSITLIASIVKFKKYQEKMENMIKCIERCITTTYRLHRMREKIRIVETMEEFQKLKDSFYEEPYEAYANCQEEIDKYLKYQDLVKHMKTYRDLSLENQKTLIEYNRQKIDLEENQADTQTATQDLSNE